LFSGEFFVNLPGGSPHALYDVTRDGRRFLMLRPGEGDEALALPRFVVVQNWFEELKRLVPTN
jgi:hypothetical protein